MRAAFIDQLINEARTNERVYLLVGDLGYNVIEPFAREFPDRFRNVGIAEQNMAGIAAGLAMTGYNVYFYSIGNFPTLRCIEQIRNDIAYHHLSVKVVAVGGGFAYADLGATHYPKHGGLFTSRPTSGQGNNNTFGFIRWSHVYSARKSWREKYMGQKPCIGNR